MITLDQYFGKWLHHPDATPERVANAEKLLDAVADLMGLATTDNVEFPINPQTGSQVSGEQYGGFRPQSCTIGAPASAHKQALAVDLFDPCGAIDDWCMLHLPKLKEIGIYMEHPSATPSWAHWAIKAPKSGKTVFYP